MLSLEQHDEKVEKELQVVEAHVTATEAHVTETEAKVKAGFLTANKAVIINTIALIVTLVGIALATERRVVIIEQEAKAEREARQLADEQHNKLIEGLLANQKEAIATSAKVAAILDVMEKRHGLEDAARIKALSSIK